MEMKWPSTLGDRDRSKQYDSYIKPLSAEDKINLTQSAHIKTQKELNKAIKNIENAINHYFKARYGAKEVIGKLDDTRTNIMNLQEEIKKLTLNALPYKELDDERINEKMFSIPIHRISKTNLIYLIALIGNIMVYLVGLIMNASWLYVVGFFISSGIFLSWYAPWSRKTEKTLATSKKTGPKIW